MADIKDIENEIRKGKNLEQNIPVYISEMASLYGESASFDLAMSLVIQIEKVRVDSYEYDENNKKIFEDLFDEIKALCSGKMTPEDTDKAILRVMKLRDLISGRMENVTAKVDKLMMHEYIVKRLEPKFGYVPVNGFDDEENAKDILRWIFKDDDNMQINERIKTAVSCLPIRYTRSKIIDMVDNTFSFYAKSDKKAIDGFDYMLRTACGLLKDDNEFDVYKNLNEMLTELENADYVNLESQHYFELKDDLRLSSGMVEDLADELTDLMDLSNQLLSVLLTKNYFTVAGEKNVNGVLELMNKMINDEADYDTCFAGTEKHIEELHERIEDEESVLLVIKENYRKKVDELMLSAPFERLLTVCRLNGSSTFATLIEDNTEIDDTYLNKVREDFKNDLSELWEMSSRLKRRAISAQIIKELPVMLSSHKEVMDYVCGALKSCADVDEKQVSINLIKENYD